MGKSDREATTTSKKVSLYETVAPLLDALFEEIQTLSKKKPEATLNTGKVKLINRLLTDIKEILKNEPGNKYLDMLEDDNLPQYSDVVLILSQYSAAMIAFREKYYGWDSYKSEHGWFVE